MKSRIVIGALLVAVGIVALSSGGITYTTRERVLDIGPIQATREAQRTIPLPPVLGACALGAGIVLLVVSLRRK